MNTKHLTDFTRQYLETALWSSIDDDGHPLDDGHSLDDFSEEALLQAIKDCEKFAELCLGIDGIEHLDGSDLGHDFWLTRNHHGAGFWDGDYDEELGNKLTEISKSMGEIALYIGDDGKLYFS